MQRSNSILDSINDLCSFETKLVYLIIVLLNYNLCLIFRTAKILNEVVLQVMPNNSSKIAYWGIMFRWTYNST